MIAYVLETTPEFRRGRGRFWKEKGQGYTDNPLEAGIWPEDDHRVKWALYLTNNQEVSFEVRTRAIPVANILLELEAASGAVAELRAKVVTWEATNLGNGQCEHCGARLIRAREHNDWLACSDPDCRRRHPIDGVTRVTF